MLYTALVPEILPEVIGAPDFTIERAIRNTWIDFCVQTLVYTVNQDPVPVYAGMSTVELDIPEGTRLIQVLRASIGPRALDRYSRDDLFIMRPNWADEVGTPVAIAYESSTEVRVVPAASQATTDKLRLYFAVAPTMASTSVPDDIGEIYFQQVALGATASLKMMSGFPWHDPQVGVALRRQYDLAIRDTALDVAQDGVASIKRIQIPRIV